MSNSFSEWVCDSDHHQKWVRRHLPQNREFGIVRIVKMIFDWKWFKMCDETKTCERHTGMEGYNWFTHVIRLDSIWNDRRRSVDQSWSHVIFEGCEYLRWEDCEESCESNKCEDLVRKNWWSARKSGKWEMVMVWEEKDCRELGDFLLEKSFTKSCSWSAKKYENVRGKKFGEEANECGMEGNERKSKLKWFLSEKLFSEKLLISEWESSIGKGLEKIWAPDCFTFNQRDMTYLLLLPLPPPLLHLHRYFYPSDGATSVSSS